MSPITSRFHEDAEEKQIEVQSPVSYILDKMYNSSNGEEHAGYPTPRQGRVIVDPYIAVGRSRALSCLMSVSFHIVRD